MQRFVPGVTLFSRDHLSSRTGTQRFRRQRPVEMFVVGGLATSDSEQKNKKKVNMMVVVGEEGKDKILDELKVCPLNSSTS